MNSLLVVLIVLAYSANSFLIVPAKSAEVSAIPWPFTVCGTGSWTIESLTMNSLPARNTNNNIIAVR